MPNPISNNNRKTNTNAINRAPPFLELSRDTIQQFGSSELDIENVLSVWTGLTKCSEFIKDGKRLENMSWRIVNRNLINYHQNLKDREDKTVLNNKLNNADFMSLLQIVSDQNLLPGYSNNQQQQQQPLQRPPLINKKSSNKNLSRRLNLSSESLEKVQLQSNNSINSLKTQKPSLFSKISSFKSLKNQQHPHQPASIQLSSQQQRQPHQNIKSEFDLASLERNADLYDQPNPKYAFGIFDKSTNGNSLETDETQFNETSNDQQSNHNHNQIDNSNTSPKLIRSNTSTSIVRGFSPSQVSVKHYAVQLDVPQQEENQSRSSKPEALEAPIPKNRTVNSTSLFGNYPQDPHQLLNQQARDHRKAGDPSDPTPANSAAHSTISSKASLFNNPHNDKRSNASTSSLFQPPSQPQPESSKQPVSLFGNQQAQQAQHHHHHHHNRTHHHRLSDPSDPSRPHHHHHHPQPQPQNQQPLNQQAGNVKEAITDIPERIKSPIFDQVNISPDLKPKAKPKRSNILNNFSMTSFAQHEQQEKKSNVRNRRMFFIESSPSPTESMGQYIDDRLNKYRGSESSVSVNSDNIVDQQEPLKDDATEPEDKQAPLTKSASKSLFSDSNSQPKKQPEIEFSSEDESISDESDWSSMSDEESDVDDLHQVNAQWQRTVFKRGETLPKPEIKRSLLSGLFLNEMPNGATSTHNFHAQVQAPHTHHQPQPLATNNVSTDVNFLVKHPMKNSDATTSSIALHHPTTDAHNVAIVSTSHVNVSGLVSEPHHDQGGLVIKDSTDQLSSSLSSMLSKSALNLTGYFSKQRKNSFSSIVSDRTRTRYTHESRAPPTASTLLPTALATHMFLPNAHQKARSRLAAVVETSSNSNETTRKNSSNIDQADLNVLITEEQAVRPSLPPTPKAIPKHHANIELDEDSNVQQQRGNKADFVISRKLSPKTTRRQMLATELSDSMRKSILWDRKILYKTAPSPNDSSTANGSNEKVLDSEINSTDGRPKPMVDDDDDDQESVSKSDIYGSNGSSDRSTSRLRGSSTETSVKLKYGTSGEQQPGDWEDETDFHTRGW